MEDAVQLRKIQEQILSVEEFHFYEATEKYNGTSTSFYSEPCMTTSHWIELYLEPRPES